MTELSFVNKKRIRSELIELIDTYTNLNVTKKNKYYIICVQHIYTFTFRISPCSYPFTPPYFLINDIYYKKWYLSKNKDINHLITTLTGTSCPCCDNKISIWFTGTTMNHIINEFLSWKKHFIHAYNIYWIKKYFQSLHIETNIDIYIQLCISYL
tara:strand:+ start:135 stop:599 length:465 start_codon:yes stop_codon:yes gene_type:complete